MQKKDWKLMNKVLMVTLALLLVFAWADSTYISGIYTGNSVGDASFSMVEEYFLSYIAPAHMYTWILVMAGFAIVWYLYSKDKSETVGIFATPVTLIFFGVQDLIAVMFNSDIGVSAWANAIYPVRLISSFLGEAYPTMMSLIISAGIGCVVSYFVYTKLQKAKW